MNQLQKPTKTNYQCIVVGGGAIGMLTARLLFLEGVDVLLVEKGALGGESSWAGGGIISPLYPWRYSDSVNILAQRSKKIYPTLASTLQEETGKDCELLNSGLFTVTDEADEVEASLSWADKWGVKAHYIDQTDEIKHIEPKVGASITQGIWMPDVMQIRNPKLIKALKASFIKHKIPTLEHTEVKQITQQKNKVTGIKTKQNSYHANQVIIASGAWSAQFASTQQSVQINPVKGQMIMYQGEAGLIKRMILSQGHYIIPRKDGFVLAGSTLEKTGFDKSLSSQAQQALHQSAVELVPALKDLTIVRHWAGLRPGTELGIPYICSHHQLAGLYVHAGHFRNGIILGAASTQLMVDIVLQRKPWCDISPYRIDAAH